MTSDPLAALVTTARALEQRGVRFAVVGGLAVTVRGEVRFTRDVDLAILVATDAAAEALVRSLRADHFVVLALVEHDLRERLATVRLRSGSGVIVDLLCASSGIEAEVVERATPVEFPGRQLVPVACAEELLALKVLSASDRRLQDRIDARSLLLANPDLDLDRVRANLHLIISRGFDRGEPLFDKLATALADASRT